MATEPADRPAAREESDDRLLGGRVRLIQPRAGYRAAIDPVLLAGAVPARVGDAVLDLGAGSGAVSLCLAKRVPNLSVTALERRAEAAALCRRNIDANGVDTAIRVVEADLARLPPSLHDAFDHVVANPPYIDRMEGTRPPDAGRAAAHADGDLALWIDAAHEALRNKGWLTLIHRADRFDRIITFLAGRFGALTLIPLWPKQGAAAKRVIIRARKGVRSPGRLTGGLILHDQSGAYTMAAQAVLRDLVAIEPN